MTRYYFHLRLGAQQLPDDDGLAFTSEAGAIDAARALVGELFAETSARRGGRWFGWTVQVLDVQGRQVAAMMVPNEPALQK